MPVAHGEGKFTASDETLKQLNESDQIVSSMLMKVENLQTVSFHRIQTVLWRILQESAAKMEGFLE